MPNVRVEDMGHKMGLNGVDNAKLFFDNVRVPRENILNKYSDVDESGQFTSTIKSGRKRFLTVADQLLSGRICIAAMSMGAMKTALTIGMQFLRFLHEAKRQFEFGIGLNYFPIKSKL